ncbi:MAG: DedA family protein [Desulfuromonadaceae bacterium]|nr:DedA family protein [Geobacteraceae bacterium]
MDEWIKQTLPQFSPGFLYYLILCGLTLAEGIPVFGLFVPGSVFCISAGALAFHGHGEMLYICIAAILGAIIGDIISYISGTRSASWVLSRVQEGRFLRFLRRAELFFAAHGGKSLLLARFLGPVRGFVPFVAGGARMRPGQFFLYTISGGILWGIIYPGVGYLGVKTLAPMNISAPTLIIAGLCLVLVILIYIKLKNSKS